jgi:hypothetical protein
MVKVTAITPIKKKRAGVLGEVQYFPTMERHNYVENRINKTNP